MQTFPLIQELLQSSARDQIIDLTSILQNHVTSRNVTEGMVVVFCPHTTAAVTINENYDPDVKGDLLKKLSGMIPRDEPIYDHAEGNSDGHVKTALVGNTVTLLIEAGRLVLGRWQGVYFCEFDGPRERRVMIKVVNWGKTDNS